VRWWPSLLCALSVDFRFLIAVFEKQATPCGKDLVMQSRIGCVVPGNVRIVQIRRARLRYRSTSAIHAVGEAGVERRKNPAIWSNNETSSSVNGLSSSGVLENGGRPVLHCHGARQKCGLPDSTIKRGSGFTPRGSVTGALSRVRAEHVPASDFQTDLVPHRLLVRHPVGQYEEPALAVWGL